MAMLKPAIFVLATLAALFEPYAGMFGGYEGQAKPPPESPNPQTPYLTPPQPAYRHPCWHLGFEGAGLAVRRLPSPPHAPLTHTHTWSLPSKGT